MESQLQSSSQRIYLFAKQSVLASQGRAVERSVAAHAKMSAIDHTPFEVHSPSALPDSASPIERSEQLLSHGDAYVAASRRILDTGRKTIAAMEVQVRGLNALLLYVRGCFDSFQRVMDQVCGAMRARLDEQHALSEGFEVTLRSLENFPLHPSLVSLESQLRTGDLNPRSSVASTSGIGASGISLASASTASGAAPAPSVSTDGRGAPATLLDCIDVTTWKSRHAIFADAYKDHEDKYKSLLELVEEIEKGVFEFALDIPINIQDLLYIANVLKACVPSTPSFNVFSPEGRKSAALGGGAASPLDTSAALSAGIVEVECPSPPRKVSYIFFMSLFAKLKLI